MSSPTGEGSGRTTVKMWAPSDPHALLQALEAEKKEKEQKQSQEQPQQQDAVPASEQSDEEDEPEVPVSAKVMPVAPSEADESGKSAPPKKDDGIFDMVSNAFDVFFPASTPAASSSSAASSAMSTPGDSSQQPVVTPSLPPETPFSSSSSFAATGTTPVIAGATPNVAGSSSDPFAGLDVAPSAPLADVSGSSVPALAPPPASGKAKHKVKHDDQQQQQQQPEEKKEEEQKVQGLHSQKKKQHQSSSSPSPVSPPPGGIVAPAIMEDPFAAMEEEPLLPPSDLAAPHVVPAEVANRPTAPAVWFLSQDAQHRIMGLPLLGQHWEGHVWSHMSRVKLYCTFANTSGRGLDEAAIILPSNDTHRLVRQTARIVTHENGVGTKVRAMRNFETCVVDRDEEAKQTKDQAKRQALLAQEEEGFDAAPEGQTMRDESSPQDARSLAFLLHSHPPTHAATFPVRNVGIDCTIALEVEYDLICEFEPAHQKYLLSLPSAFSSRQVNRKNNSMRSSDLRKLIKSMISYSFHFHVPRPSRYEINEMVPFEITSFSHNFEIKQLNANRPINPNFAATKDIFDVYHVSVGNLKPEATCDGNGGEVEAAGLEFSFSLARSNQVEVLAMREVAVPELDPVSRQIKQPLIEKGSFMIQITPPMTRKISANGEDGTEPAPLEGASKSSQLLDLSPPFNVAKPIPRFVTFLLDASGSMCGAPWAKLRGAIEEAIHTTLNPMIDYVNVIIFDDEVTSFSPTPRLADGTAKVQISHFLRSFLPRFSSGTTAMHKALTMALQSIRTIQESNDALSLCQPLFYFATDGSQNDEVSIASYVVHELNDIKRRFKPGRQSGGRPIVYRPVRILTLGIGLYINKYFLNYLARSTGGGTSIATTAEDIEDISTLVLKQLDLYSEASMSKSPAHVKLVKGEPVNNALCLRNIHIECALEGLKFAVVGAEDNGENEQPDALALPVGSSKSPASPISPIGSLGASSSPASPNNRRASIHEYYHPQAESTTFLHSWPAVSGSHVASNMPDLSFGQSLLVVGTYCCDNREGGETHFPQFVTVTGELADGSPYRTTVPIMMDINAPLSSIIAASLVDAQASHLVGTYGRQSHLSSTYQVNFFRQQLLAVSVHENIETTLTTMVFFEVSSRKQLEAEENAKKQQEELDRIEHIRIMQYEAYVKQQLAAAQQQQQQQQQGQVYAQEQPQQLAEIQVQQGFQGQYIAQPLSQSYMVPGAEAAYVAPPRPVYVSFHPTCAYAAPRGVWGGSMYKRNPGMVYSPGARYSSSYGTGLFSGSSSFGFDWGSYFVVRTLASGIGSVAHSIANLPVGFHFNSLFSFLSNAQLNCCEMCCGCQHMALGFIKFAINGCCSGIGQVCEIGRGLNCIGCLGHVCANSCEIFGNCCHQVCGALDCGCICKCVLEVLCKLVCK